MTVTSNIHVGLPGWSNATYSVGQRRSNAGNAYQCSTPGTSTAPPIGMGTNISAGGTSRWDYLSVIDFSTLQAWEDSIPSTLSQPYIGLLWNDGVVTATAGTAILAFSGHTTSTTNTITLTPAPGEGFLARFQAAPTTPYVYNNANGVSVEFPASGFGGINYIQVDDNNIIFRGLQIKDLNASSGATVIGGLGAIWIDKCIIEGQSQAGGARMLQFGAASVQITNSLIIDHSIGNPTSATVEAAGTGCKIAYSTFVKTASVAGSCAMDANTNSTAASNTVRGCIFVGYDTPFIGASGQPWATDHNAYTNASFTSLSATDTGGSVFGATTSTLFVHPTADYHQNSSSPCLNAGVTDTTDIPTADDIFGVSRPQGANWDIGPHELLAGHTILRDLMGFCAFSKSSIRDVTNHITYNNGLNGADLWVNPEWRGFASFDLSLVGIEPNSTFPFFYSPFSPDFSSEFGIGSVTWNVRTLVEWRSGVQEPFRDATLPLEWRASPLLDNQSPVDWRSMPSSDAVSPIEFRGNMSFNNMFPLATGHDVIGYTPFSSELLTSRISDDRSSLTFSTSIGLSRSIPVEWKGVLVISRDGLIPIDWRGPVSMTGTENIDFRATIRTDRTAVFDINRSVARSGLLPVASMSAPLSSRTMPIDWAEPISSSTAFDIELGRSAQNSVAVTFSVGKGIGLSISLPFDPHYILATDRASVIDIGTRLIAAVLSAMEIGGNPGSDLPVDRLFSAEWGRCVSGTRGMPVEIKGSSRRDFVLSLAVGRISSVDYSMGTAWSSVPLSLARVPTEWGHLLLTRSSDAAMPLDILATVHADISPPLHQRVGQDAIGSQLEGDQWEQDNEPCC